MNIGRITTDQCGTMGWRFQFGFISFQFFCDMHCTDLERGTRLLSMNLIIPFHFALNICRVQ
jgi:hypothetical protein